MFQFSSKDLIEMSMNFNSSTPPPVTPKPKKNNNKKIAEIIIVVVLGTIGAIGVTQYVISIQDNTEYIVNPQPTSNNNLEQKLFDKCQKLQDWYRTLDGFENTNYHCDQYAKAWSGLVK
jgi:hypothetical protein